MEEIIKQYKEGLITTTELQQRLEAFQVRGAVLSTGFMGYDYKNQKWIDVETNQ